MEDPSGPSWAHETLASHRLRRPAACLSMRASSLYWQADQRSPSVESLVPPTPSPTSVSPEKTLLSPLSGCPSGTAAFAGADRQQHLGFQGGTEGEAIHKDKATSGFPECYPLGRPYTACAPETGRGEAPSALPQHKGGANLASPYRPTEASRSPRHQTDGMHFTSHDSQGTPWCPSCHARAPFCYSHPSGAPVSPRYPAGDPSGLSVVPPSVSLLSPRGASGDTAVTSKDPADSSAASRAPQPSPGSTGSLSGCSGWSSPSLVRDPRGSPRRSKAPKAFSKTHRISLGPSRRTRGSSAPIPAQQEPTSVNNTLGGPQSTL